MKSRLANRLPTQGRICDIAPARSDPNYQLILVDDRIAAVLRATDCQEIGLKPGLPWTQSVIDHVARMIAVERARRAALQILSRRAISKNDLIARLLKRGHESNDSHRVVEELRTDGWLDDERLANSLLHELRQRGPIGRELAIRKLEARGISTAVAERAVTEALADQDVVAEAVAFAQLRLRRERTSARKGTARRIAAALAQRGFEEMTIEAALDQLHLTGEDSDS